MQIDRQTAYKVVLACVLLLVFAGGAYAAVDSYILTEGVHLDASEGPEVKLGEDANIDAYPHPFPDDNTVALSPYGSISSDGPTYVYAEQFSDPSQQTILSDLTIGSNTMTVTFDERAELELSGGVDRIAYREIAVDNGDVIELDASSNWELTIDSVAVDTPILLYDGSDRVDAQRSDQDGVVTFSGSSGSHDLTLQEAESPEYDAGTAEPDTEITVDEDPVTLGIDVSHPDGLDMDGTFYVEGDEVGTDSVTGGEGRMETTVPVEELESGENEWSLVIEDELGSTTTFESVLQVPDELIIRDEITKSIITSEEEEVTVRFFEDDTDQVVTRTTTDGVVNMSGLDVTSRFIATVDVDGYMDRRILVESLLEQQNVFVLPQEEDAVFNEFVLQDETGEYPPSESILIIERPIQLAGDEQSQYRAIAGDEFGADRRVPVDLLRGERYRIIVQNAEGERRSLGSYTGESDGTVELNIGDIGWPAPDERSYGADMYVQESDDVTELVVEFNDPNGVTSDLDLQIENRFDDEWVIYEESVANPHEFRAVVQLEGEEVGEQWAMSYTIDVNGEERTGYVVAGGDTDVAMILSSWWLQTLSMVLLVVLAALYPADLVAIGGFAIVAIAGVLMLMGWAAIPVFAWFAALLIAVGGLIRGRHVGGAAA